MNKKINGVFLMSLICCGIIGCSNVPTSSDNNSISSPTNTTSDFDDDFNPDLEGTMEEGVDYINHNDYYESNKFTTYNSSQWYINSLNQLNISDPFVYEEDGKYYITGTSERSGSKVIDIWVTEDFVEFNSKDMTTVYDPSTTTSWEKAGDPQLFAPEIYKIDGYYYIYYTGLSTDGKRYNSVIRSSTILGKYQPIVTSSFNGKTTPAFKKKASCLDATVFIDDDKQMYMYYADSSEGEECIWGVKLKSPYEADWTTAKKLARPGYRDSSFTTRDLSWEMYSGYYILEAPYMIKSKGKYYLTYSCNDWKNKYYSVCYAVGTSPLGSFTKPYESGKEWSNLLLGYSGGSSTSDTIYKQWTGFASGTGHHSFFKIGDQTMIAYHAHQNRNSNSGWTQRYFVMDYVYFDDNGVPFCNGPTYSLQPLPEAISGYRNIATDAELVTENVKNAKAINDNYCVSNYNIKGEESKEVTLVEGDTGYAFIQFNFDEVYEIGGMAIYNSAYYDKYFEEIKYINFGDGNILECAEILATKHINYNTEFIFPNSGVTLQFPEYVVETDQITICFEVEESINLNEIKILAR